MSVWISADIDWALIDPSMPTVCVCVGVRQMHLIVSLNKNSATFASCNQME